jgi:hypothetical protein
MNPSKKAIAPTFYAQDQDGRRAPLIMSVCAEGAGDDPLSGMPPPVLDALDHAIQKARCDGLISYIVNERSDEEMERRSAYLMQQLFDQDKTILLVRSETQRAADAFMSSIRKHYHVRPFPARRLATAA